MGKRKMYKNAPIICDGRDGMSFVLYIIGWISRAAVHFAAHSVRLCLSPMLSA